MNKPEKPTLTERVAFLFSPERADRMYNKRLSDNKRATQSDPKMTTGGGYAAHGASQTLNSLIGWIWNGGSAPEDIDKNASTLRQRSRDLFAGGGLARSGPLTMTTNVVGWGIKPKPKIDGELLKLSDEECDRWERQTLREFELWANNVMCDVERQQNFYGMQQLAFLSQLVSGDVFAVFGMKENKRTPYQTVIRLLEADRISTPESDGESEIRAQENGGMIVDGVEIGPDGEVLRYYIANRHPLQDETETELKWEPIDAFGAETGLPNILHVKKMERPEQRRGIPFISSQIEKLKQLDRYINSELAANVVSSMLTAFIESEADDHMAGLDDAVSEEEKVTDDDIKLELAPGAVYNLPAGKKITSVNPIRNNSAFKDFVDTQFTLIGADINIPKEVLIKKYESNYTAARGALLDFWRNVRVERTGFNNSFNQPVYEQWLAEAVAIGRIQAPGFFEDPIIRQAWCGCMWMGVSMGHVDPMKEVNAAEKRIKMNMSTEEQEAAEYNGGDWNSITRQRKKELQIFDKGASKDAQ